MASVPVIDLAPARGGGRVARLEVAHAIDAACRAIGFFAVSGHGVPDALVHDLRGRAHEFFALPLTAKLAARHPVPGTNRGYHPVGGETLATANDGAAPPDLKVNDTSSRTCGRPRPLVSSRRPPRITAP